MPNDTARLNHLNGIRYLCHAISENEDPCDDVLAKRAGVTQTHDDNSGMRRGILLAIEEIVINGREDHLMYLCIGKDGSIRKAPQADICCMQGR